MRGIESELIQRVDLQYDQSSISIPCPCQISIVGLLHFRNVLNKTGNVQQSNALKFKYRMIVLKCLVCGQYGINSRPFIQVNCFCVSIIVAFIVTTKRANEYNQDKYILPLSVYLLPLFDILF